MQKIEEAGLTPRVSVPPSDTVPTGQVSSQNPGGGAKIGKGSTVTLDRLDRHAAA